MPNQLFICSNRGDDANPGTVQKPIRTLQHAANLSRPGDTIFLQRGDTFLEGNVGIKGKDGISLRAYGIGPNPILHFDVSKMSGLFFNACSGISLNNIHFQGYHSAHGQDNGAGLFAINCPNFTVTSCEFDGAVNGMVALGDSAVPNLRVIRCVFHDLYPTTNNTPSPSHSQGIYMQGQANPYFQETVFIRCGWHPAEVGDEPTQFNHAIYHKNASGAGPLNAQNCVFLQNSNSGLTADAGGTADTIFSALNGQTAQSPELWVGGEVGTITNNVVYKSLTGGFTFYATRGHMGQNLAFGGQGVAYAVDFPHGHPNTRPVTPIQVQVQGNMVCNWVGNPVQIVNGNQGVTIEPPRVAKSSSMNPVEEYLALNGIGASLDDLMDALLYQAEEYDERISARSLCQAVRRAVSLV